MPPALLQTWFIWSSQGTIISLAALTQPDIAELVEAAALLCPISYLEHISSRFVLSMVHMHLDQVFFLRWYWLHYTSHGNKNDDDVLLWQMILAMGIHQLNFRRFMLCPFSAIFSEYYDLIVVLSYIFSCTYLQWLGN